MTFPINNCFCNNKDGTFNNALVDMENGKPLRGRVRRQNVYCEIA